MDKDKLAFIREFLPIIDECRTNTCKDFNGALFMLRLFALVEKYHIYPINEKKPPEKEFFQK